MAKNQKKPFVCDEMAAVQLNTQSMMSEIGEKKTRAVLSQTYKIHPLDSTAAQDFLTKAAPWVKSIQVAQNPSGNCTVDVQIQDPVSLLESTGKPYVLLADSLQPADMFTDLYRKNLKEFNVSKIPLAIMTPHPETEEFVRDELRRLSRALVWFQAQELQKNEENWSADWLWGRGLRVYSDTQSWILGEELLSQRFEYLKKFVLMHEKKPYQHIESDFSDKITIREPKNLPVVL